MYNTQLVGNPNDLPTIKASASFVGLGVISSDQYYVNGNGAEWYIEQVGTCTSSQKTDKIY